MTYLQERFPEIQMLEQEAVRLERCEAGGGYTIENPDIVRIGLAIIRMPPERFMELYDALMEIFS